MHKLTWVFGAAVSVCLALSACSDDDTSSGGAGAGAAGEAGEPSVGGSNAAGSGGSAGEAGMPGLVDIGGAPTEVTEGGAAGTLDATGGSK